MAVIQISKIQVRRGLQENLPQLASGEMGWSVDGRRLYIGNGTLAEGSPEIGNTEILTELSQALLNFQFDTITSNIANLQSNITSISSNITILQDTLLYPSTLTLANGVTTTTSVGFSSNVSAAILDYRITRDQESRVGTVSITHSSGANIAYSDEYTETNSTGVTLDFVNGSTTFANLRVTLTSGTNANLKYFVRNFI